LSEVKSILSHILYVESKKGMHHACMLNDFSCKHYTFPGIQKACSAMNNVGL
jgi:hypothetical protein